ncbi:MAG TPA: hypothetical protein VF228_16415 [Iamia sp.]
MRRLRDRSTPELVRRVGMPPGDPAPDTVTDVVPGSWWPLLLGLLPALVVTAASPVLGVDGGPANVVMIVTAGLGLLLASLLVQRRWERIWRATVGRELPPNLIVGLTVDHLVVWAGPRPAVPEWRPELVLGRGGTRLRPTMGGLGPYVVTGPDGPIVRLDGDLPSRRVLARIAVALDG